MYLCLSLGWIWLSGLPSVFSNQSEKVQATLETFWQEKEFGVEELMRRTVEKEYCGVLGTTSILSCKSDRKNVDNGFDVESRDV